MEIRQAQKEDLDSLLELDRQFWSERQTMLPPEYRHHEEPMPADIMQYRISGEGYRTFIAELNGQMVGYLAAKIIDAPLPDNKTEKEGRVCDVFVLPEFRRRGIATSLYKAANDWFDEQGCVGQGLTVYSSNPAFSLYEKWGFISFSHNMRKKTDKTRIREHNITLRDGNLTLRPMTENDWDILLRWNCDPEVLWFAEGEDVEAYPLETVQMIYRGISQKAFCFIMEVDGTPIGECWLQQMNLEDILKKHPDKDCRRIDLIIGEKSFWGQGYGTRTLRLLTVFGFEQQKADIIYGCSIADYNPRSFRTFEKVGYVVDSRNKLPPDSKGKWDCHVVLTRYHYITK